MDSHKERDVESHDQSENLPERPKDKTMGAVVATAPAPVSVSFGSIVLFRNEFGYCVFQ